MSRAGEGRRGGGKSGGDGKKRVQARIAAAKGERTDMPRWALPTAKAGHSCTSLSPSRMHCRGFRLGGPFAEKNHVPSPRQPGLSPDHLCPTGFLSRFPRMCHHGTNNSVLTPFGCRRLPSSHVACGACGASSAYLIVLLEDQMRQVFPSSWFHGQMSRLLPGLSYTLTKKRLYSRLLFK